MNTERSNTPLYKVLNEERTQGEWVIDQFDRNKIMVDTDKLCAYVASFEFENDQLVANAQYTALAVNNLAVLAEALDKINSILKDVKSDFVTDYIKSKCNEALNKIS